MARPKGIPSKRKGKTYEEIFGLKKSIIIKEKMKKPKSNTNNMGIYIRTKTIRKKLSKQRKGISHWTNETKQKYSKYMKKKYKNGFAPLKGKLIGNKNPAKRLEVRKKISEKAKGKNNYFYGKHFSGELNSNWQGGKSFEPYGFEFNENLKKLIRKREKYKCHLCKKYGKDIHHIDYNKKNNNPNNLITLCKSCHAKTGSNRCKWKKYFKEVLNDKK